MSRADRILDLFNYSIVSNDSHGDYHDDDDDDNYHDDQLYDNDKDDYVSHHDSEHAYIGVYNT